jgi:hypothetical protein
VKLKIEKVPMLKTRTYNGEFQDFVMALRALKVGESFVYKLASNNRMAISIAQYLLDRRFTCQREKDSFRVGRIE